MIGHIEFLPSSCVLGRRTEPDQFLRTFHGKVYADIDIEEDAEIGYVSGCIVQLSLALNSRYPLEYVFDATESVARMQEGIFELDEGEFYSTLKTEAFGDILFIEELGLYPAYRGKGLGQKVLRAIEAELGSTGCEIAVLEPYPLQFSEAMVGERAKMRLHTFSPDKEASTEALKRLYENCGYQQINGVSFMYKPLC